MGAVQGAGFGVKPLVPDTRLAGAHVSLKTSEALAAKEEVAAAQSALEAASDADAEKKLQTYEKVGRTDIDRQ